MSGPPVINWLINIYKPHEYYSHLRIINHRHGVILIAPTERWRTGAPHHTTSYHQCEGMATLWMNGSSTVDAWTPKTMPSPRAQYGPVHGKRTKGRTENGLDVGEMPISKWGLSWKVHADIICMCIYLYIYTYLYWYIILDVIQEYQ